MMEYWNNGVMGAGFAMLELFHPSSILTEPQVLPSGLRLGEGVVPYGTESSRRPTFRLKSLGL